MIELFQDLDGFQQFAIFIVCFLILFMLIDSLKRDRREAAMQAQIDALHDRLTALNFQEGEIERLAGPPDLEAEVID
jgi:hypothetical protein